MATVKELRAQAKAAGIKGYSGMKKAELESVLSDLNQPEIENSAKETNEVTEALKTAESETEIKAILEGCPQEELHEVYLEYTGHSDETAPSDWSKEETVRYYTVMLNWYKEDEKQKREMAENIRAANEESENEVQKVMDAITAVNYEPKATREILKAETENFQHAMLHIMHKGLGSVFDEYLRISELTLCVKGIEKTETRQEYIKNAVTSIGTGRMNIEYCRNDEAFREYLPMHEERQKYYEAWQEYLESYEVRKELSA